MAWASFHSGPLGEGNREVLVATWLKVMTQTLYLDCLVLSTENKLNVITKITEIYTTKIWSHKVISYHYLNHLGYSQITNLPGHKSGHRPRCRYTRRETEASMNVPIEVQYSCLIFTLFCNVIFADIKKAFLQVDIQNPWQN